MISAQDVCLSDGIFCHGNVLILFRRLLLASSCREMAIVVILEQIVSDSYIP